MRQKIVSSLLIIAVVLTACSTDEKYDKKHTYEQKLKIADTLSILIKEDMSQRAYNTQIVELEDSIFLLRENWIKKSIDIFDLKAGLFLRSIEIPSEGPNAVRFYSFLFHNKDTIFCFPYRGLETFVFDWYGSFKYKKKLPATFRYSIPAVFSPTNQSPAIFYNNILSLTSSPNIDYRFESDKYHVSNFCMHYNLEKVLTVVPDIYYPHSYIGNVYPIVKIYRTYNNKTSQFINSFSYSHYLYISNYSGVRDSVKVQSKYMSKIPHFNEYKESQRAKDCFIENMYADIIYDKYRDVYYRFVALPGDEKYLNRIDIANQYLYRPFVIMLLDSDFNILNEFEIPSGKYNYYDYFVDAKGLWISSNNPESDKFDENHLRYSLITFD